MGSKIERHSIPTPKVSTAHGTSTVARRIARPLKAWCMQSAKAMPSTSSIDTEMPVKMNVLTNESQNSLEFSPQSSSA